MSVHHMGKYSCSGCVFKVEIKVIPEESHIYLPQG